MADETKSTPAPSAAMSAAAAPAAATAAPAPAPAKPTAAAPPAAKPAPAPVPPPEPKPNPLPEIPLPFQGVDFQLRGIHAEAVVDAANVVDAAREMDKAQFSLDTITGVDWLAQEQMELIYDFFHQTRPIRAAIRARIPRDNPEIDTISAVFPGANWHERETHDFFGIVFKGHPDLSPFLLPEDETIHPLRKDFAP